VSLHEQSVGATDEWYTPPHVFDALGCSFDTDVASPGRSVTPWIPAKSFIQACSLDAAWRGFVWMNPPFGGRNGMVPWLAKFFEHRNGIALTPDRTSAPWWQKFAPRAEMILFVSPKLKFIGADGKPGDSPAQGTCLMAAGRRGVDALYRAANNGLGFLTRPAALGYKNWAGQCAYHCGQDYCGPRLTAHTGENGDG
jgi:DNA N-6-adenine-methyltransferase Dam